MKAAATLPQCYTSKHSGTRVEHVWNTCGTREEHVWNTFTLHFPWLLKSHLRHRTNIVPHRLGQMQKQAYSHHTSNSYSLPPDPTFWTHDLELNISQIRRLKTKKSRGWGDAQHSLQYDEPGKSDGLDFVFFFYCWGRCLHFWSSRKGKFSNRVNWELATFLDLSKDSKLIRESPYVFIFPGMCVNAGGYG